MSRFGPSLLLDSTLIYVRYRVCSQQKKIIVTADRHSASVKADLWRRLPASVPYSALQGLTELIHSRCFRAGTDMTG